MFKLVQQDFDVDTSTQTSHYEGGWSVIEECREENGRVVVTKLTIQPTTDTVPPGGVNSRVLRHVHVGRIFELLRLAVMKYPAGMRAFIGPQKRRPRWARNNARFYAELAQDFCNVLDGKTDAIDGRQKPTASLAKMRRVPLKLLRSQLNLARKKGFLTKPGQGQTGGTLTKKAKDLLERMAIADK
jgi:hypothetical protein